MRKIRAILSFAALAAASFANAQEISFEKDVRPIFEKRCFSCHSPQAERLKGKFDLSTAELALKGGGSGAVIVPGDAEKSPLVQMIEWKIEPEMPPKGKFEKIPQEEIDLIKQWIAAGAITLSAAPAPAAAPAATTVPAEPPATPEDAHAAPISAIALSPDGSLLARGSLQKVELLQADASGQFAPVRTLEGHAEMVRALAFSKDGALLAAAGGLPGRKGEVKIWRPATGELVRTIEGHADNILDVAFSPDGARLATCSYDRLIKIWSIETGEELQNLKDHVDAVFAIDYSPDGKFLASGAGDRTVKIWDMETGKRILTLSDSLDAVLSVAFSPDGTHVAAGAADKMIRVWDVTASGAQLVQTSLTTGVLTSSAFAHEGPVLQLAYASDGKTLFSASEDRRLKAWDASNLAEKLVFEDQSDWVQALALSGDGQRVAVGRYDSTSAVYAATGERLWPKDETQVAQAEEKKKPGAGRINVDAVIINATIPPSLGAVNPVRQPRGTEVELTVDGKNLADAQFYFMDGRITVEQVASEALPIPEFNYNADSTAAQIFDYAQPYRVKLKATIPADFPESRQPLMCRTPQGVTNAVFLDVLATADVSESEPNDTGELQPVVLPATLIGAMNTANDVDRFRVQAAAGQELVFVVTDSANNTLLRLRDAQGNLLARSEDFGTLGNPRLGYHFEQAGDYYIEFSDPNLRAGVGYRLHIGAYPFVYRTEPMGIAAGPPQKVKVFGFNIGGVAEMEVDPPDTAGIGATLPLPIPAFEANPVASVTLALSQYGEAAEAEPNNTPAEARVITAPFTVNGRIEKTENAAEEDLYRFAAKADETLVLQIDAAKLGSRLDSVLEVCDLEGKVLQRAQARCVARTILTLADRDSKSIGLRLEDWSDFRVNDFIMIGNEVLKTSRVPGYADEDMQFEAYPGQRKGFFETTPTYHAINSPIYKVEIHPPDAKFPPNGMPVFPLYWRNDDAFEEGKPQGDSRIDFQAPADGEYLLRVISSTGEAGPEAQYRLTLRPLQPDFDLFIDPYWNNISPGEDEPINVRIRRRDGFDAPVQVQLAEVPAGFTTTGTEVLPGEEDAAIALTAAPDAVSTAPDATFKVVATTKIGDQEITKEARIGAITVTQKAPDLVVHADKEVLALRPGKSDWLSVKLDRNNGFTSRVPIRLLNLPFGVRVLDTGLNGILVREGEQERSMEVYAEPWVKAMKHTIYIQAQVESASPGRMLFISKPVVLDLSEPEQVASAQQ